jgi:hypothetical protein
MFRGCHYTKTVFSDDRCFALRDPEMTDYETASEGRRQKLLD